MLSVLLIAVALVLLLVIFIVWDTSRLDKWLNEQDRKKHVTCCFLDFSTGDCRQGHDYRMCDFDTCKYYRGSL